MYLRLVQIAVECVFLFFDFGGTPRGTGAYKFKEYQGFEPTPLHYRYILHGTRDVPNVNPSNPRFDRVRRVWSRLPVPLVRLLGPHMMRYFP